MNIAAEIRNKYKYNGDLLDIFLSVEDADVRKWHHYIPIYDRYFSMYRNKNVRFLEIGVCNGGTLQMWRKYFGDDAIVYGIDIDTNCMKFDGIHRRVRIGSQDDSTFLRAVIEEMGGVDIVLDDGSHQMNHIKSSIKYLFPHLREGGIYMVEDLHTSYWRSFGGGLRSRNNFFLDS